MRTALVRCSIRLRDKARLRLRPSRTTAGAFVAGLIFLSSVAPSAQAQDLDHPFKLRLSIDAYSDSNVFRVASGAPDPQLVQGITGKADHYLTASYGLRFEKSYAQQHFVIDLGGTATRYDKFSSLDRNAYNNHAQWDWHLGPRISGTLSADHVDSAVKFEDITLGRSLVTTTTDSRRFTVDGWLFGGWHLLGGASRSESVNSQAFFGIPGSRETNTEFGLKYVAASGSSISAMQRWSDGIYPGQNGNLGNLIDNRFTVRETELSGTWIASMRSTLNGRLTWLDRSYKGPTGFDFSGLTGEIRYSWTPTGRLSINASVLRNLTPFFQLTSSYRADDTISISPSWAISDKVSLALNANRMVSDYLGPVVPIVGPLRRDTTSTAQLTASWAAHRKLMLGASVQLYRRQSNYAGLDYDGTLANVTASLKF